MIDAQSLKGAWKSERLVYRYLEDDDQDAYFLFSLSSDSTIIGMSAPGLLIPPTKKNIKKNIEGFFHSQNVLFCAVICLPSEVGEPTPIGMTFLSRTMDTEYHRNALLAISLLEDYRGKGYGREAINFILDFGFQRANLHRVGLKVYSYNQVAFDLYKKIGFVEEGREREAHFLNRQYHDIISMSMLEHEWAALRGLDA
jgi:RimJ/RimL family protein N-acetyltransferase